MPGVVVCCELLGARREGVVSESDAIEALVESEAVCDFVNPVCPGRYRMPVGNRSRGAVLSLR